MNASDNDNDADYEEGSFLDRIKESPRTVSALIIILIVAAAIYAFSGDNQPTPAEEPGDQVAVTDEQVAEETSGETSTPAGTSAVTPEDTTTPAATAQPVTQEQLAAEVQQLPEPRKTNEGYVEVAQTGEGVTHVSRRALTRWLSENQAGYAVSNEHRIYIEDYIQNRIGAQGLSLGEEKTVSYDLIKEAVAAASQLNDSQLRNLSQYTYVLS